MVVSQPFRINVFLGEGRQGGDLHIIEVKVAMEGQGHKVEGHGDVLLEGMQSLKKFSGVEVSTGDDDGAAFLDWHLIQTKQHSLAEETNTTGLSSGCFIVIQLTVWKGRQLLTNEIQCYATDFTKDNVQVI